MRIISHHCPLYTTHQSNTIRYGIPQRPSIRTCLNFHQPVTSNPSLPISIFSHCSRVVYPISPLANLRFGPGQELALKTLKRTSQVGKNRTLLPHQKPTVAFVRQKKTADSHNFTKRLQGQTTQSLQAHITGNHYGDSWRASDPT